jgi:HSP20 family protein
MTVSRWDPFDPMGLRRRVGRLLEAARADMRDPGLAARPWAPPVDILETEQEIVVSVELPGMKQEEIEVELAGDTLSIGGERRVTPGEGRQDWHILERPYGPFSRSFTFAVPIDQDHVSASYEAGVLQITVPKAEEAKPKQIKIEVE